MIETVWQANDFLNRFRAEFIEKMSVFARLFDLRFSHHTIATRAVGYCVYCDGALRQVICNLWTENLIEMIQGLTCAMLPIQFM
jgi:hypothetical protein